MALAPIGSAAPDISNALFVPGSRLQKARLCFEFSEQGAFGLLAEKCLVIYPSESTSAPGSSVTLL